MVEENLFDSNDLQLHEDMFCNDHDKIPLTKHQLQEICCERPPDDDRLLIHVELDERNMDDDSVNRQNDGDLSHTTCCDNTLLAKQLVSKVQLKALHVTMASDLEKLREQCRQQENEIFSLKQVQSALEGEVFELQQTLSNTEITHQQEIETVTSILKEKEWKTLSHFIVDKALTNARTMSDTQLTREQPCLMTSEYFDEELKRQVKEIERELRTKFEAELQHVKVELEENKTIALDTLTRDFTLQRKQWENKVTELQQTMAALESTLVETHQKYQKEKDRLQANHNNELSKAQTKLDSVTEQLTQVQVSSEERHQQDSHALELVHKQFSQVQQERDALHNALTLLQQSVASLLPLSSTIEAVLPKTDKHHEDLLDEEDSPSISPSNEPVTPPTTEWTSPLQLQQDPTVQTTPTNPSHKLTQTINTGDSGLASQQTSVGRAQMEGALKQAPPPFVSHLSSEVYIGNVIRSLQPQDTTSCDEDTPKAPPSTMLAEEEIPVITSGRLIPHDLTILSLNSTVTDDHTHFAPELSIVQLERSHEITDNVDTIQEMISQLYQSVTRLLENFLTTSTQAIQYQQQLGDVQGDLVRSQTNLTSQLQHVERLQQEVLHLQHQISNHMTSNDELLRAQEKIASLITEVEILRQSKGEETTELITETEHLLQEHCHLEQSLTLLKTQLNDKQEEVNKKEETCQQYQQQISAFEHEIVTLQTKLSALQQVNKELQMKNENNEMQFRQQLESLTTSHNNLEAQLKFKNNRIHELEDLPAQLLIKEEKEEELLKKINELTSQLTTAQHELACSVTGLDNKTELLQQQLKQQKDNYSQLIKQHEDTVASLTTANEVILRNKTTECQLQEELTQCQSVLKERETEVQEALAMKAQVEENCVKLREQIDTLTGQVETLHRDLQISSNQVSQLCQRLEEKETTSQDELSQLKIESTQHLQAFEKSIVRVQSLQDELTQIKTKLEERENELEVITISKAELEDQQKSLQKEKMEKEEFYQLQVLSLHNNLKQVQSELSQKCSELEFVQDSKESREMEMKQLEEKLQDEYAGQLALLKLQIKELSLSRAPPTSDDLLLQQIAELAPVLERDANEVQELCQETKQQQQIEALKADNNSLKKDIASAEQTMSELEQSMNLANTTLSQLQQELHNSTSRETQLLQQLEQQASDYQKKLNDVEQQYQDMLSTEREKHSKALADHKQTKKEKQDFSDKYDQLVKQYEEISTRTSTTELHLQDSLSRLQQELQQAHLEAKQSNDALKENVTRVTKLLAEIEDRDKIMSKEKTQFEQSLQKEKECVMTLKSALRNKETELTKVVDQYLQEKVTVAQLKGENSGLQARLTALQEEHMEDLQYQNALQTSETKCRDLALSLRQLEGQCKALVFQKRYLCSELDAFYHTQQATLMMIQDMGDKGIPRLLRCHNARRFKIVVITVVASIRWYNLYQRHKQRRKRNRPKHDHSFVRVDGNSIPIAQGIELFSNQTGVYLTERLQHKLHK